MTDRKPGKEPSLFDLPLRRTSDGATEEGSERGAEADAEPRKDGGGEQGAVPRGDGERGPEDGKELREELAFWEMEPETAGGPLPRTPPPQTRSTKAPAPEPTGHAGRRGALAGEEATSWWADLEAGEVATGEPSEDAADGGPAAQLPAAVPAALTHRLAASLLDGGVLLVVAAGAILGAFLLGVRWRADDLPALGMFLLVFSFVYSVMPLAFWGRTPGMALARVLSRGSDGGPLTFGQTALRWLAGLLTVALAGLPLLLALPALGGRSLADRMSGSHTWLQPDA